MKIIVENSTWNNIGDGFYQSSLFMLITKLFPEARVFMGEGPIKRAFQPKEKQFKNSFKMMEYQNADIHIFSGPIIRQLITNYKNTIINITKKNARYALISCSSAGINEKGIKEVKDFFSKYPPLAFSSRDTETYLNFKDSVPSSYDGICTAFLVEKLLPIDMVDIGQKYFVSSFYQEPEPVFTSNGKVTIENIELKSQKNIIPTSWNIARHLEFLRTVPENLQDHTIIRAHQGVSNKVNHYNFAYPNSYITLNPITYLSIFKGAEFTISDRVHACAVTLAFGKPARLISNSLRAGIFSRLGMDYKESNGIMHLNVDVIDSEMKGLRRYIKDCIK
jgi:hypothetical protein